MKTIDWVFIGYFIIGLICGIIAVKAYTKEYGKSPASIIIFVCNFVAWIIVFPDQMIELKEEKEKKQS